MTILNTLVINFILPTSAEFPHVGLLAPFDFVVVGLVHCIRRSFATPLRAALLYLSSILIFCVNG
jgi:hypothetical protein